MRSGVTCVSTLALLLASGVALAQASGEPAVAPVVAPTEPPKVEVPAPSTEPEKSAEANTTPAKPHQSAANNAIAGEMTPALDAGIERGLAALARLQKEDGSFGDGAFGGNVAITSLACLAFMANGDVPGRGAYGDNISKGLEFVLKSCEGSGLIAGPAANGPMYGHGFATLFLGEVYGMTVGGGDTQLSDRVHQSLVRAVRLIETTQNDEGGWRYNPVPYDADVSVTICQVMALRSARNAGLETNKNVIDRAVQYVRACQNPDGGFRYQMNVGQSAWPRSAAGVATLYYAGIYEDRAVDSGLTYLRDVGFPGKTVGQQIHYWYGQYYTAQAMFLSGGSGWADWWPQGRAEILKSQSVMGLWEDASVGNAYGTSMALIVLQMPKRYLPIFQK
jgi:hypothetical protein